MPAPSQSIIELIGGAPTRAAEGSICESGTAISLFEEGTRAIIDRLKMRNDASFTIEIQVHRGKPFGKPRITLSVDF